MIELMNFFISKIKILEVQTLPHSLQVNVRLISFNSTAGHFKSENRSSEKVSSWQKNVLCKSRLHVR
jgi:hypothetical protein